MSSWEYLGDLMSNLFKRSNRFSRVAQLLSVSLIVAFLSACGSGDSRRFVIGGVLPLTGDAGTFGRNAARGATLAVRQANESHLLPGLTVDFTSEDSRGTAAGAVLAARKLLDFSHAKVLIGDVTSAGTQALAPIITERRIPLISPAASDPKLSNCSPFFARVWPSDVYEAQVTAGYARDQRFKKIAVVYANTDYGLAMVDQFKKVLSGVAIDPLIPTDRESLDYRPVLQRIKLARPDALFFVLYPEDAVRLLSQAAEIGLRLPMLATATFEDPKLLSAPGADRVVFASPVPPDNTNPERAHFLQGYKTAFGEDAGVLSDTGYDAAMILIKAWAAAGPKGADAVAQYIRSLQNYAGVSGEMTFDKQGDVQKPYRLRTVKGGKFVWL